MYNEPVRATPPPSIPLVDVVVPAEPDIL